MKGIGIGRPPLGRASSSRQRIIRASDQPQGDREPRLDRGVLEGAHRLLERGDRLGRTALQQQRAAEEMQSRRMLSESVPAPRGSTARPPRRAHD